MHPLLIAPPIVAVPSTSCPPSHSLYLTRLFCRSGLRRLPAASSHSSSHARMSNRQIVISASNLSTTRSTHPHSVRPLHADLPHPSSLPPPLLLTREQDKGHPDPEALAARPGNAAAPPTHLSTPPARLLVPPPSLRVEPAARATLRAATSAATPSSALHALHDPSPAASWPC